MKGRVFRLACWLAASLAPAAWRDSIAGDLEEERARRGAARQSAGAFRVLAATLLIVMRLQLDTARHRQPLRAIVMAARVAKLEAGHAVRRLARHRTFSAAGIAMLTLGIGVNAAAFAICWHVLLQPLPWPDEDRLVQIWNTSRRTGAVNVLAPANYFDFAREATSFERMAAYNYFEHALNLTGHHEPIEIKLRAVTGDYFDILRMAPRLGRTLGRDDERPDARVIVISEHLWRRHYGSDPGIVGRVIRLDDRPYEVVGVMPAAFDASARPLDGWVPYYFGDKLRDVRFGFFLGAVGRLKPGIRVEQAAAELATIAQRASERYPASNGNVGAAVRSLREELLGTFRVPTLVVITSAVLVLLMACANLAGLHLGQVDRLRRELAIRAALGASRRRLFASILLDGLMMALVAGAMGLLAGIWGLDALTAIAPPNMASTVAASLHPAVFAYVFCVSLVAGLLFACLPAYRATRPAPVETLRSRTAVDRRSGVVRTSLIAGEVAIATALLVSAGMLLVSLLHVLRVDPGFDAARVVAADVRLPASRYPTLDRQIAFFDELGERLQAARGVQHACASNAIPLETAGTMTYVPDGTKTLISSLPVTVTPECFQTLGISIRRGRGFQAREAEAVAIVSDGFARRAWGDANPIGQIIREGLPDGRRLTVIAVVADTRRVSLESAPFAQVYRPAEQAGSFVPTRIIVRMADRNADAVKVLREAVWAIDSSQPVENIRWLEDVVSRSTATRRFTLLLIAVFAALALALAAIGVYGLLVQLVSARRAEIGVRLALGATPGTIVRLVAGGALLSVAAGIVVGLGGAFAASRVLQMLVFSVSATSPAIYASVAAILMLVAIAAAYLPTRHATRIDPVLTLRAE